MIRKGGFSPKKLYELRIAKGFTQTELGVLIGKTYGSISGYESGKFTPSPKSLKRLSECFGVDVEYFFVSKTNKELVSNSK